MHVQPHVPSHVRAAGTARTARLGAFGAIALALVGKRAAAAASNDASALKTREQAVYTDYLSTDFAAAEQKLLAALAACGRDACSRSVIARLQVALGEVAVSEQHPEIAAAHFTAALKADPAVTPDEDIANPDVRSAFDAAKRAYVPDLAPPAPPAPPRAKESDPSPAPWASTDAAPPPLHDSADCPPGLLGCPGEDTVAPAAASADDAPFKTSWVSVAFQQDVVALGSRADACAGGTGYSCFDANGQYYQASPLPGADDAVEGGLTPATKRILIGYDHTIGANVTLGGRLGFAFGGGPQRPASSAFLPLHVEAKATWTFGHRPFARTGVRLFALAAAGAAEVDAGVPVNVYASSNAYRGGQGESVVAWRKSGLGFAALGGGVAYAFTRASALALELRAMEMFPTPTTGAGLQIGYVVGL